MTELKFEAQNSNFERNFTVQAPDLPD